DRRLFQAIPEEERSGSIIPDPAGSSFATWLKSFGWLRGGLAMGAAVAIMVGGTIFYKENAINPSTYAPATVPSVQQPIRSHSVISNDAIPSDKSAVITSNTEVGGSSAKTHEHIVRSSRRHSTQLASPAVPGQSEVP